MVIPATPEVTNTVFAYVKEHANFVYLLLNRDGTIVDDNAAARSYAGTELIGKPFTSLLVDFANNFDLNDTLFDGGKPHLLNILNGSGLPLTFYFQFVMVDNDHVLALGEQSREELELLRQNMLELNADLTNLGREVQKKNVELETLHIQKDQFFGMASHDLRHPLAVVYMYAGFLANKNAQSGDDQQQKFLNYILESCNLMEGILNDFLDFSVFESGTLQIHHSHCDAVKLVERVVDHLQPLASKKQISMHFAPQDQTIEAKLDQAKMEQVLNNLITNAIKYSQEGGDVEVGLTSSPDDLTMYVKDNGPGIEQQYHEQLFTPYAKVPQTVAITEKSSGLGLAIVKKIVDSHHGTIQLESKPGSGSLFSVTIPLKV